MKIRRILAPFFKATHSSNKQTKLIVFSVLALVLIVGGISTAYADAAILDGDQATVNVSPNIVPADGASLSTITIQLKDSSGINCCGNDLIEFGIYNTTTAAVKINGQGAGVQEAADSNGRGVFTVSSTSPGTATFKVTDRTQPNAGVSLPANSNPVVKFEALTSLSVGSVTSVYNGKVNLTATLTTPDNTGGKTISFTINGTAVCGGSTGASCPITTDGFPNVVTLSNVSLRGINVGDYPTGVGASFAGDISLSPPLSPSSGTADLNITKDLTASISVVNDVAVIYDGLPHAISTFTNPPGLSTTISYEGINGTIYEPTPQPPTNVGAYNAIATENDPNYNVSVTVGHVNISPATPNVTVAPQTLVYNGNPQGTTAAVTGVLGEVLETATISYSGSGGTVYSSSVTPPTNAGSYTATASFIGDSDYIPGSNTATVTINQAPLSVTANNQTMIMGGTVPTLTGTLTGVLSNDGITASYTTNATSTSPVNNYTITPILHDPNNKLADYSVTNTNGILTITPIPTPTFNVSITRVVNKPTKRIVTLSWTQARQKYDVFIKEASTSVYPISPKLITNKLSAQVTVLNGKNYNFKVISCDARKKNCIGSNEVFLSK